MSILEVPRVPVSTSTPSVSPYVQGDRLVVTSPEGDRFLVRVESVTPAATGDFTVLAAIVQPRRYRSHVLTTTVGADGYGPAVRRSV